MQNVCKLQMLRTAEQSKTKNEYCGWMDDSGEKSPIMFLDG